MGVGHTLVILAALIGAGGGAGSGAGPPPPAPPPTNLQFGDGTVYAEFEVVCNDTFMVIIFNKTALDERDTATIIRPFSIEFDGQGENENCMANSSSTSFINTTDVTTSFKSHIYLQAMYPSGCGMNEIQDADYIRYNQTLKVTYGKNPNSMIRREEYDYYNVQCLRNRTNSEMLNGDKFQVELRTTGSDAKNDTAEWNFNLTHTDMNDMVQSTYKLGEKIKFTLEFNTNIGTVKQRIQRCWATSDGSSNSYNLIKDLCASDVGTTVNVPLDKSAVFTTEAFRYINQATSEIYVECLVLVCQISDSIGGCSVCGSKRKKRSLNSDSNTDLEIVRSSVFYIIDKRVIDTDKPSSNNQQSSSSSSSAFSGPIGIVVVVLLASLVFLIAVVAIKKVFFQTVVQVPIVSMKGIDNNGMA